MLRSRPQVGLLILLLVNLLVGVLVVRDYGESWDEHLRIRYAERSLAAYQGGQPAPLEEKGPFYVMIARLSAEGLRHLLPGWNLIQSWHFINFLSFLMGLAFFYVFCLRWTEAPSALLATLLLNTQPLLWGHAFINPKDIPFMSFFLGSVVLGLGMVDRLAHSLPAVKNPAQDPPTHPPEYRRRRISRSSAWLLVLASVILLGMLLALAAARPAIQRVFNDWLEPAYYAQPGSPLERLADALMPNRTVVTLQAYQDKFSALYPRLVGIYAGLVILLHFLAAAWLLPDLFRGIWHQRVIPFVSAFARSLSNPRLLAAGLLLGFSASIRVLGPFSGLLVTLYALRRTGRKAAPALAAYLAVGFVVTILSWPGLWGSPVRSYLESFGQASDFPWEGKVTFAGQEYAVGELPRAYLPTLFGLQFTEPLLLVAILGAVVALKRAWKPGKPGFNLSAQALVVCAWFALPVGAAVILQPTMYDNFRQFLFAVPPIFLLANLGIHYVLNRFPHLLLRAGLVAALLLPGVYWIAGLHPYEYTYYNQLVGGVSGAFRSYELDYWATSYQEATQFLNESAPPGARIVVWGADHLVQRVARPDLEIFEYRRVREQNASEFDYAIILTRHDKDLTLYPQAAEVLRVARGGAVFAVVKQLSDPARSP